MHWFWRCKPLIAGAVVFWLCGLASFFVALAFFPRGLDFGLVGNFLFWYVVVGLTSHLAVVATTRRLQSQNTETRCRKCNYILRGISEPRCPECGERI